MNKPTKPKMTLLDAVPYLAQGVVNLDSDIAVEPGSTVHRAMERVVEHFADRDNGFSESVTITADGHIGITNCKPERRAKWLSEFDVTYDEHVGDPTADGPTEYRLYGQWVAQYFAKIRCLKIRQGDGNDEPTIDHGDQRVCGHKAFEPTCDSCDEAVATASAEMADEALMRDVDTILDDDPKGGGNDA